MLKYLDCTNPPVDHIYKIFFKTNYFKALESKQNQAESGADSTLKD